MAAGLRKVSEMMVFEEGSEIEVEGNVPTRVAQSPSQEPMSKISFQSQT